MMIDEAYKKYITDQMQALAAYDAARPDGHVYEFHVHAERVAYLMKDLALTVGYDADMADILYSATLPHDIGKMALPVEIWDLEDKPTEDQKAERRTHTTHGINMIRNEFGDRCDTDPFLKLMLDIMENHHETMDGQGFLGKTGNQLSREVRMACICDAFDGWSVKRPHFGDRDVSPSAVVMRMEIEKAGQFDQGLLEHFKKVVIQGVRTCQLKPSS
jgi:polar amino acid transport system substrate-binding protein